MVGIADYFKWTPRIAEFDETNQIGPGSRVLLACLNGNQREVYIIGGLPHPDDTRKDPVFKDNHRLEWEFNGIYFNINKDGEIALVRRGPTKADGKLVNPDATGNNSSLQFLKTGNIKLGYNLEKTLTELKTNTDKLPYIEWLKSDKQINITAPNGVKINKGGADSQALVRGTAYRQQQQAMHNTMQSLLTTLSSLILNASVAITGAAGVIATPVVGPALSAPFFIAAGTSLSSAVATITNLQLAIQQFESASSQYLSTKHEFAESEA